MDKSSTTKKQAVDNCQMQIWKIRRELESYSVLFKSLDLTDAESESFYGVGLAFERMSKKLDKINDRLNKIY